MGRAPPPVIELRGRLRSLTELLATRAAAYQEVTQRVQQQVSHGAISVKLGSNRCRMLMM
jgi:hypothetical protein